MWGVCIESVSLLSRYSSMKVCFQSLRWKKRPCRKPVWLPRAPSKLFRLRQEPDCSEEESHLISTMYKHYKTAIKSLRTHFIEDYEKSQAQSVMHMNQEEENAELERNLALNEMENARVAKLREADEAFRLEQKRELLLKLELERQQELKILQEKADELVRQTKEQSESFITYEKLEKAIEHALDNPVSYNFAIDLDGNIYQEDVLAVQQQSA